MGEHLDTIIVGGGISGIGTAYHFQKKCPGASYTILEARADIGGTWDLFRYPGIRSDSDMYTLGYSFRPWKERKAIADGPSILRYVKDTAKEFRIDKHILLGHKVIALEWSSAQARWLVDAEKIETKEVVRLTCRFLIMCSGYYDYDEGYTPEYPGVADFKGKFIHPQKWNESTAYDGKNIVVIGSGATAVTLVPELAKKAAHVVMLQRSPTYFAAAPSVDHIAERIRKYLPEKLAHTMVRWKNILFGMAFFNFCRRFPLRARKLLLGRVERMLRGTTEMKHFTPTYNPWDQRLCLAPDGDLFKTIRAGKAEIVTDKIKTFAESGIVLESGKKLPADVIVTATGLKLKFLAGLKLNIDGKIVNPADSLPYKGAMLSGVPNFGMAFGYTNASWTLKCDLIGQWLARMIRHMNDSGFEVVTPELSLDVKSVPLIDFTSGYFQRAKTVLPMQGNRSPWKMNQNYFADLVAFKGKSLRDDNLRFKKALPQRLRSLELRVSE